MPLTLSLQESKNEIHNGHTFSMVAATDDEATISRLASPRTPRTPGSRILQQSPVSPPELPSYLPPDGSSPSFQPLFRSDSEPLPPHPPRPAAVAKPKTGLPRYHCDACFRLIETDERFSCIE